MVVKCEEIVKAIGELAPEGLAESWDNPGLTVGDPQQPVKKVLTALDVTEEVIAEAVRVGADMIVTHHPMILFQKIKNIRKNTSLGSKIYHLIEHRISACCAHTNLDISFGGTNDVLAELIGLEQVSILEETDFVKLKKLVVYVPVKDKEKVAQAICDAGAGHIGMYSHCTFSAEGEGSFLPLEGTNPYIGVQGKLEKTPEIRVETIVPENIISKVVSAMTAVHPYEEPAFDIYSVEQKGQSFGIGRMGNLKISKTFREFALDLKTQLKLDNIRLIGNENTLIKRVGLCTGSGVEFMEAAKKQGADVYLTGDIKFHEAQRALEMDLCVADVTHYASENLIVPVLQAYLMKKAQENHWDLEVVSSDVDGQTFWHI